MKLSIASLLALLLITICAQSAEEFSFAERVKHPAKIPSSMTAQLTKQHVANTSACQEIKDDELYEAQLVSLSKSTKTYLVKPAHACLCSAHDCPMWLFKVNKTTAKLIWETPATSKLEIMDKKLNGYSKLKEVSAVAGQGHESIWAWNTSSYTEIYKNVWHMDAENKCRLGEETTELVDGRMVQHTISCPQNEE
ncbi:hypothetical protein [Methylophilus sp. QUAN]|uniref:hypothetical protein n=1 Tax=Methylophilus sp. QUAN TaxID=2781020 RepID=UPI0018905F38|nr:hypothetical protein [Methylophilus sp. QUAN]MBF4990710.1 hypothetical protein [Methylophilus sp. QUAN]